jgi:hypothetical protein
METTLDHGEVRIVEGVHQPVFLVDAARPTTRNPGQTTVSCIHGQIGLTGAGLAILRSSRIWPVRNISARGVGG